MYLRPGDSRSPRSPNRDPPGAFPSSPSPSPKPSSNIISAPHSLAQAVKARKEEYIRKKIIRIKVGSWNVAAISGTEKDLGGWFVHGLGVKGLSQNVAGLSIESSSTNDMEATKIESVVDQEGRRSKKTSTIPKNDIRGVPGGEDIGLYVLGLQEVVDISSATEALRPYIDTNPAKKWKQAMETALPPGYQKVAEQQLLGLLILIYASPEVAPSISSVSATSVGTGLMGYLGNKGAVSVRLVLGETTKFVFVNCHLAAGSDNTALNRRIWDTGQILSRTRFAPITEDGEVTEEFGDSIGDEDYAFWFGDLNYRLDDIPGEDVRRLLLLHTRNEYDVENKSRRKIDSELGYVNAPSNESSSDISRSTKDSNTPNLAEEDDDDEPPLDPKTDPASLHTTIQSLLQHDQLRNQQKQRKVFYEGWLEGDINFLPTYKYDVGSIGMFDSGEKKRSPSWCDRILYRTRKSKQRYEKRIEEEEDARKKDEEVKARGLAEAVSEHNVLFEYDPDVDGLAYGDDYDETEDGAHDVEREQVRDGGEDSVVLDHYVSHQRVLSSDHKPLDAVFTLAYDAVIPELKAKVHQDVARELDKAENEGRPGVTLVVDNHPEDTVANTDGSVEPIDMNGVNFGQVRYGVPKTRGLTIANTGQIPATFSFIDRPVAEGQKGGIAPAWLDLQTEMESNNANDNENAIKEYTLPPGETTNVGLTILVSDFELVHELNTAASLIEDILVLRIRNGRDHFIPLRGAWMQSSFCRTLDELVRVPEGGIRKLQRSLAFPNRHDSLPKARNTVSQRQNVRHSAPRELFTLTEAIQNLVERSIAEWEMVHDDEMPPWKKEGIGLAWPFEPQTWTCPMGAERSTLLAAVREALDTSSPVSQLLPSETSSLIRLELLAETLITFLQSLRDGIVPSSVWSEMETQIIASEKAKVNMSDQESQVWLMDMMAETPVHSVSFTFIVFMLTRIMNELAPPPSDISATPKSSRWSMSSTQSGDSGTDAASVPQDQTPGKGSFFPALRRRVRTNTSSTGNSESTASIVDKRAGIQRAFIQIFADLMIRSERDRQVKGKERKLLQSRKKKVLEPFLSKSQP